METKSCACNAFNEWECQVKYSAIIWQIKPAALQTVRSASMTVSQLQIDSRRKRHEIPFCSDVMWSHPIRNLWSSLPFASLNVGTCAETKIKHKAYTKGQARPQIGTFNFGDRTFKSHFGPAWPDSALLSLTCGFNPHTDLGPSLSWPYFNNITVEDILMIRRLLYQEVGS